MLQRLPHDITVNNFPQLWCVKRKSAEAVVQILFDVLGSNRFADRAVEQVMMKFRIDAAEKGWVVDTAYDIIRYKRVLQLISEGAQKKMWRLLGAWLILKNVPLPVWQEFAGLDPEQVRQAYKATKGSRAVRESIPDWLDARGEKSLGEQWNTELKALNEKPRVFIRVNTLKTTPEALQAQLKAEGIRTTAVNTVPYALEVPSSQFLFQTESFRQGLFEVQDAGSQCIAPFLHLEPGMRVIDACCGAGGKTLHLAALMKNKGRLIAMDVAEWKLDELKKRARRAGVDNLEIKWIDSSKTIKRLSEAADRVLLDVPCSGTGVLRRNPDAKWKLHDDYIDRLVKEQRTILQQYSSMVKKGGELVYATCSILQEENADAVQAFMAATPGSFELVEERHLLPSAGFDGFYMARLKRLA